MAALLSDRVAQYSPSTGTGNMSLGAAVPAHRSFASAFGSGPVYYGIVDEVTGDWETGLGSFAGSTLTRTTVFASSAGGVKVAFIAGNKIVYNAQPAEVTFDQVAADARYLRIDGATPASGPITFAAAGNALVVPLSDGVGNLTVSSSLDPDLAKHHVRFVLGGTGGADGIIAFQSGAGDYIVLDPAGIGIGASGPIKINVGAQFQSNLTASGYITAVGDVTGKNIVAADAIGAGASITAGGQIRAATALVSDGGTLQLRRDAANRVVYFMDADAEEKGLIYSAGIDDAMHMRVRTANITRAELIMNTTGSWQMATGFWDGINFGAGLAGARTDLARHINLHTAGYGFSVTSASLNINMNTGAVGYFVYANGTIVAQVEADGAALPSVKSVVTVEKGDPRYRNASNLNAGTIPSARMPTDTAERDRIMDLIASTAFTAIGECMMMRTVSNSGVHNPSTTESGANLVYSSAGGANSGTGPPGTWRCQGYTPSGMTDAGDRTTLWKRTL